MSEIQFLIDAPIGALFFVSGAIAVVIMLVIAILKKGTDLHSVSGYTYFFALSFTNYAAAMAYYKSLLPIASVMFTVPISTLFIILGLASIIPAKKSPLRIFVHIFSMCVSSASVLIGTLINWYHFSINSLSIFSWSDLGSILVLSLPIATVAGIAMVHYARRIPSYHSDILKFRFTPKSKAEPSAPGAHGSRSQTVLVEDSRQEINQEREEIKQRG